MGNFTEADYATTIDYLNDELYTIQYHIEGDFFNPVFVYDGDRPEFAPEISAVVVPDDDKDYQYWFNITVTGPTVRYEDLKWSDDFAYAGEMYAKIMKYLVSFCENPVIVSSAEE